MFCRQCGNELYDTDLFCNRCGAPVVPGPAPTRRTSGSEGLTPAAKDSERIIEEFYRNNRRKEETQSILDMEFAAINGMPIDPLSLDAIVYRGRDGYDYTEIQKREAARREFMDQLRPNLEKAADVIPHAEIEREVKVEDEPIVEIIADEPVEIIVEEAEIAEEPVETVIEESENVESPTIEDALTEEDHNALPKYIPTPKDEEEWNELFPAYTPMLFFDPPEYYIFEEVIETPDEQVDAAAPEQPVEPEQPEKTAEQPTAPATPPKHDATDILTEAENNMAAISASISNFDSKKASINQEAQATLSMLDEMFADFDKPIAASVAGAGFDAASNYSSSSAGYGNDVTSAPNSTQSYTTTYKPVFTPDMKPNQPDDLDKFSPATASAIATGKAIQKAAFEEEPPEEGFEDDEDFIDDLDAEGSTQPAEGGAAANDSGAADKGDASDSEKPKKEKRGLFRRKSKDEPIEEEKETPTVQKRSNVIVLNPEFLNPDEKASGKQTEDFRIASNMTHGVKAMDRNIGRNDDDYEEYYYEKRGGSTLKKVFLGMLTALLAIAAVVSILITFGRDTSVGKAVLNFWDNLKNAESGEDPDSEAEMQENEAGEEGETDTDTNSGGADNQQGQENQGQGGQDDQSNQGAPTNQNDPTNQGEENENQESGQQENESRRFVNESFNAAEGGLGEAVEEPDLTFDSAKSYALEGYDEAASYEDSEWYQEEGESVTYNDALFDVVTDYYSKLIERMNRDSEEVLSLIVPETKLMTDVSGIKSDAVILHAITKLEVGEVSRNDTSYFVIVRINEVTNDGRPASTYKRVLRLVPEEETHSFKVAEVVVGD